MYVRSQVQATVAWKSLLKIPRKDKASATGWSRLFNMHKIEDHLPGALV